MPLQVQLLPVFGLDRRVTQSLTSYLLNDIIAIDAGSLGLVLDEAALLRVDHILLTHAHLDHVASLPILVAEIYAHLTRPLRIHATPDVIEIVRAHLFNAQVWMDFTTMPLLHGPIDPATGRRPACVEFVPLPLRRPFDLNGLRFTAVPVTHPVPTVGLIVEAADAAVVFTSDTTHTDELWQAANGVENLRAVFIDCSFPNEFHDLAVRSGHMTPQMVGRESRKLTGRPTMYCVHLKPGLRAQVAEEIAAQDGLSMVPIEAGKVYTFGG